jgi:hypothetical protein
MAALGCVNKYKLMQRRAKLLFLSNGDEALNDESLKKVTAMNC